MTKEEKIEFLVKEQSEKIDGIGTFSTLESLRITGMHDKFISFDFDVCLPDYHIDLQRMLDWTDTQAGEYIAWLFKGNIELGIHLFRIKAIERSGKYKELITRYDGLRSALDLQIDDYDIYQIIDGKQRVNALTNFYSGLIPMIYDGKEFWVHEVPEANKINPITCKIINYDISDLQKIEIYNLINFCGNLRSISHRENLLRIINKKVRNSS